jgi:hypothetical protein
MLAQLVQKRTIRRSGSKAASDGKQGPCVGGVWTSCGGSVKIMVDRVLYVQ